MFKILVNWPSRLLVVLVVLFSGIRVYSQDAPTFSQFPLNPFQFNPSYAGHNGYAEANVFYRKQWIGIENAPEVGAFNIQAPVGRNVSLGLSVLSNKTILLNTTSALATFGYRVRMGYGHYLNFGLSGGVALNKFDLAAVADINDPALANVIQNNQNMISQFGFNYQYKNFKIGFALPSILDSKPNSLREFQEIAFDPFDNKFGSVSYDFYLGDFQVSPLIIYRALDSKQDQWEGMVMTTYRNFIWIGASYRDGYGLTGMIGVKLKGMFRAGYAYEHPTSDISKVSGGSHEVYLGARLGSRDREEEYAQRLAEKDSIDQIASTADPKTSKDPDEKEADPPQVTIPDVPSDNAISEVITDEKQSDAATDSVRKISTEQEITTQPATEVQPNGQQDVEEAVVPATYYVVLGAFESRENALKQMNALQNRGRSPEMMHITERNYYYVFTFKSDDRNAALAEYNDEKAKGTFPDVWIYKVDKD